MKFPRRINTILPQVLKDMGIDEKIKNWEAVEGWPKIVGPQIAAHSHAYACNDDILWVEVDDPVWQSQLFLIKNRIIEKLKRLNFNIQDIKFQISKRLKKENG